jgi:hypothetical protein
MKKFILSFFILLFCFHTPLCSQEPASKPLARGDAAKSSVYDSLAISMASWGVGLAVGIGLLCALLEFSTGNHAHDQED